MKLTVVALASILLSAAVAQPHKHQHKKLHAAKRDYVQEEVVVEIEWVYVTETVASTATVWVDSNGIPVSSSGPIITDSPGQFYEAPAPSRTTLITSVYVPPAVVPVSSPAPTSSPAPVVVLVATTTTPVVALTTSTPSSGYSGVCSSGSPCTGDLTFYEAGLGACGTTNNGDSEKVIALPYGLMGTQSNGNPYCGKTVTIVANGQSVVATVVDKCMGCTGDSIDLSNAAWLGLGIDFAVGRTTGHWYFN